MYSFLQFNCQNLLSLKNLKWGYHCSLNIVVCSLATHIVSQSVHQHAVLRVCENLVCNIVAGGFSLNLLHCLEKKNYVFQKLPVSLSSGRCKCFIFFPMALQPIVG